MSVGTHHHAVLHLVLGHKLDQPRDDLQAHHAWTHHHAPHPHCDCETFQELTLLPMPHDGPVYDTPASDLLAFQALLNLRSSRA